MATLKHIASKNADYARPLEYLIFEHTESGRPVRDESGKRVMRDRFIVQGINCDPFSFDKECEKLNAETGKNRKFNEIKSHHYIISYDPLDREECGLTPERAQELGMEFASRYFPGHQIIVCTHNDGHNGSGNIHTHIIFNSVRMLDVTREPFMDREIDSRAGYKHHPTDRFMNCIKKGLMEICEREGLHQVDLITPAKTRITNEEYRVGQHGQQRLDELNREIIADGMEPTQTVFQTQKQYIRDAVMDAATRALKVQEFERILKQDYRIELKDRRGRFSYLHPERKKYITGRALGIDYEKEVLLERIRQNAIAAARLVEEQERNRSGTMPDAGDVGSNSNSMWNRPGAGRSGQSAGDQSTYGRSGLPARPVQDYDPSYDYQADPIAILYIRSELRLVVDLQTNIKARQSEAYAEEVELSNLLEMSRTVAYIQEQGIASRQELNEKFEEITDAAEQAKADLRDVEEDLKNVNEQIHYAGRYYAVRKVHGDFMKAWNKGLFRSRHREELDQYDEAVSFFREKTDGSIPVMKDLKERKERLLKTKEERKGAVRNTTDYQKNLRTAVLNVEAILGPDHSAERTEREAVKRPSRNEPQL